MRRVVATLTVVLLASFWSSGQTQAQVAGDEVVPSRQTSLKVKSTVVDTVGPGDVLVVEQVQGDWLWVRSPAGKSGWVKVDAVSRLDAVAPGSPDEAQPLPPLAATPRGNPPPTEPLPAEPPPADPDSERLYLIGAMGGSLVYTTYAYIGVLADSLSKDLYTTQQVQELLKETIAMSQSLIKRLERVRAGGLTEEDQEAIDKMIAIHKLLQDQAQAASRFAATRSAQDAETFDTARSTVWPRISQLLGIENAEEQ